MISWLAQYNKALVPLAMALIYFLNTTYGIEIPLSESEVMTVLTILTTFFVWLVPNKKAE